LPARPGSLYTGAMLDRTDIHPLFEGAPDTTEFRKLRKRIIRLTREAIDAYGMARRGDRWLVCLSGGKDSYTLLAALTELQWRGVLPVVLPRRSRKPFPRPKPRTSRSSSPKRARPSKSSNARCVSPDPGALVAPGTVAALPRVYS
jgi:hypothetical protein